MTETMTLLSCVGDLVGRCPATSLLSLLKKTQEGLGMWIVDSHALVSTKGSENALKAFVVCTKATDALSRLPAHDGKVLDALQILVTSLLQSKKKQVVNAAVAVWNDTFGRQPALYYPRSVRTMLKQLRPIADLSLPTFPETLEEDPVNTPPQFSESQELGAVEEMARVWSTTPSRLASPFEPRGSPGVVKDTPVTANSRRGFLGRMPGRLKHMDSQIEFAPIEVGEDGEEAMDSQVLTERQKEVRARQGEGMVFPGLGVPGTEKGKGKRKKVGSEDLVSVGLGGDGQSDEPAAVTISDEMEISRIRETQGSSNQNETASFISGISDEASYRQFLPTEVVDGEDLAMVRESSDGVEESFEMVSPTKADWEDEDGDIDITRITPADEDSDASLALSDPPSIEDDDFVDAPDHPTSNTRDSPGRKRNSKAGLVAVAVEVPPKVRILPFSTISPSQTDSDREAIKSSDVSVPSSPGAQIIDEERASHGLPATPKPLRGKRRLKRGSASAPLEVSPDILDTITISGDSPTSSSHQAILGKSLEVTPSKSKSRVVQQTVTEQSTEATPSKSSKSKSKAATPSRGSRSTKQVQESPAETTPSRQSKSPRQPTKTSPPRTRASAKKGVAETPGFVVVEPGMLPFATSDILCLLIFSN